MPFEIKHFTPEQLAKLAALNPSLNRDLGLEQDSEEAFQEAMRLNTESWQLLEKAYQENTQAYKEYVKAKQGKPRLTPGHALLLLLFFFIVLKAVGG